MYHCVQSLLSVHLKPELLLDGKVERLLPFANIETHTGSGRENVNRNDAAPPTEESSSLPSISTLSEFSEANVDVAMSDHEDDMAVQDPDVIFKDAKTPWTDDDIRRMIVLKAQGHTHEQVAVRF